MLFVAYLFPVVSIILIETILSPRTILSTTFIPVSFAAAVLADIPAGVLFDDMAVGVLAGGFFIRLGCAFNGCCVGRETDAPFGVVLHDTRGVVEGNSEPTFQVVR